MTATKLNQDLEVRHIAYFGPFKPIFGPKLTVLRVFDLKFLKAAMNIRAVTGKNQGAQWRRLSAPCGAHSFASAVAVRCADHGTLGASIQTGAHVR